MTGLRSCGCPWQGTEPGRGTDSPTPARERDLRITRGGEREAKANALSQADLKVARLAMSRSPRQAGPGSAPASLAPLRMPYSQVTGLR